MPRDGKLTLPVLSPTARDDLRGLYQLSMDCVGDVDAGLVTVAHVLRIDHPDLDQATSLLLAQQVLADLLPPDFVLQVKLER